MTLYDGNDLLVYIYSAQWCEPCKKLKPALQALSTELGFRLEEIDIDERPVAAKARNVMSVPTVIGLKSHEGEMTEVFRVIGAKTKHALRKEIEPWL